MNRTNFLTLSILLLGAMTYGIIEWRHSQVLPGENIDRDLTPDFIAEALKSNIYTKSGQLSHEVIADRMEHYAKLEVTHFELPQYTLFPKNKPTTSALPPNSSSGSESANSYLIPYPRTETIHGKLVQKRPLFTKTIGLF